MTTPLNPLLLATLKAATEKACRAADRKRKDIAGAVNWADLHCVSVERYEELYGDEITTGYRAYIEEASPNSPAFRQFISDHLAKQGFKDVEVRTEW
jgi:hypothetical protein